MKMFVALIVSLLVAVGCVAEESTPWDGSTPDDATSTATNLRVSVIPKAMLLEWDAPEDVDEFEIQWRRTVDADWTDSETTDERSLELTELNSGTNYFFRVRAVTPQGDGGWSGIRSRGYFDLVLPVVTINTDGRQAVVNKDLYLNANMTL